MADKKNTQRDYFNAIKALAEGGATFGDIPTSEIIDFCDKKLEQLENKVNSSKKKTNDEHDKFIDVLLDVMSESGKVQCSKLLEYPEILNFPWADGKKTSGQRISYILNNLEKQNMGIVRVMEKKIAYFEYVKTSNEE